MNRLQAATRVMRDGLEEIAALLVGERAGALRRDDSAAPGVGLPLPRRPPLKRPLLHGRKGMAPWQKVAGGPRRSS
ncbi:hypothetical protein [Stenotrophomonas sp. GZD-301]|uniref:hypothetical protein n=1 Tax=Stenotrophomonas sp. GZD-301 TaxID=3404814 RepID=UPI003BB5DD3D